MSQKLVKHGSMAGYRAELETDSVCERCRNASRVYNMQYTKAGKAKGLHYRKDEVIDNLYRPARNQPRPAQAVPQAGPPQDANVPLPGPDVPATGPAERSLSDRLRDGLAGLTMTREPANDYVPTDDYPDYISPIDPDPEPGSGTWSEPKPDEYVVTAETITEIKDNLGMYLATVGMTLGLIDPYCGTAIRENLDDMVGAWAKVISHYPSAVKLFMAKGGGKIMAWIDALMATWPVLLAIYEHHLAKTVTLDSRGMPVKVDKSNANANGHFATQPDFNYTVE